MSLVTRDLSVDISGKRIVSGIDITVGDNEFVGLLGPNGSGKSTILKSFYRVNKPSSGSLLIDGSNLIKMKPKEVARRLAVVAQDETVEFDFSVREMVMIGRTPHHSAFDRDNEKDREAASQAIERVGCSDLVDRRFNTLSGGEKQRVLIARAVAQGASHLLLDEPTNHLDIRYQIEILELVAGLGFTVLAALHDLSLAALYCDSVYLMSEGRIIAHGTPSEVITEESVRDAYGADVIIVEHPETRTPHLIPRRSGQSASEILLHRKSS